MNGSMTVSLDMHSRARIQSNIRQGGSAALMAVALDGEAYCKRNMGVSPSSPGDFPGVDTGNLRAGIHVVNAAPEHKMLVSSADYSLHLEYGTVRMGARPFMKPTAKYMGKAAPKIVGQVIARHIK